MSPTWMVRYAGGFVPINGEAPTAPPDNASPATPTGLTASGATAGTVALSWTASTDSDGTIDHYEVRRDGALIASPTASPYTATGLSESTSYTFTVRAVDNDGASSSDASVNGTTTASTPPSDVTHGSELTIDHVGPWTLQGVAKGAETLLTTASDGRKISNWPGEARPAWYPTSGTYVYNNNPANHGGVVPAGGMVIDGISVPAGVTVVQFRDMSGMQVVVEGTLGVYGSWPGVFFRGIRWRSRSDSIGFLRDAQETPYGDNRPPTGGTVWMSYCDLGGLGETTEDYCEVALKLNYSGHYVNRCYFSKVTTAIQCVSRFVAPHAVVETFIEDLSMFERQTGNSSTEPHLNGISVNGGDMHVRLDRNRIVAKTPDGTGSDINQTDCIAFFQDSGAYPGTGINDDGTTGYRIRDNFLGGTGFCIYPGGGGVGPVSNMHYTGNEFTTRWYVNGGSNGAVHHASSNHPVWGSSSNEWADNTWADDYGTGTGLTGRQYPSGDGPRVGDAVSGG